MKQTDQVCTLLGRSRALSSWSNSFHPENPGIFSIKFDHNVLHFLFSFNQTLTGMGWRERNLAEEHIYLKIPTSYVGPRAILSQGIIVAHKLHSQNMPSSVKKPIINIKLENYFYFFSIISKLNNCSCNLQLKVLWKKVLSTFCRQSSLLSIISRLVSINKKKNENRLQCTPWK